MDCSTLLTHTLGTRRYAKYGYCGADYCKACSESFRSHLFRTGAAQNGCRREAPCDHCGKILAQFDCSVAQIFERVERARTRKVSKAAVKNTNRGAKKRKGAGSGSAAKKRSKAKDSESE